MLLGARGRSVSDGAKSNNAEESAQGGILLRECMASGIVSEADVKLAAAIFLETSSALKIAAGVYATLPRMYELPTNLQSAFIEIVLSART